MPIGCRQYKPLPGKAGGVDCRQLSPDEKPHTLHPISKAGLFMAAGNTPNSHPPAMTLDTQMTLALLQELLMALRASDADG